MGEVMMSSERMTALAETFPGLVGKSGVRPFDPSKLDAAARKMSSGEAHAARFLLSLWHSTARWKSGAFNVVAAFQTWDAAHRAAFVAWASAPWQP